MLIASTVIRAASPHCRLTLHAAHQLLSNVACPRRKTTRLPDDVDVVLTSDLIFSLSGVLNGVNASSADVLKSQLAQHLVEYFQANASELGIAHVSSMYIGEDGFPKLKIVSSRCLTPESELRRVHVTLVGIELNYVWNTSRSDPESTSNSLVYPFATHLSLPFQMLLDNVICRFFTWHLVKRYPLIFGPWCKQLDIEIPYFGKIYRSISGIIARSPNPSFRKKCMRLLRTMQHEHAASLAAANSTLATYYGSNTTLQEAEEEGEQPELTDDEAFSLSMEIRYRTSLRRPQFKGSSRTSWADNESGDEELSQDQVLLTPDSSQRFEEDFLWQNPSTILDADFGIDFDLPLVRLASPTANLEGDCYFALDMGMEIEYQEQPEVWSDLDADNEDFLCLSSDSEPPRSGDLQRLEGNENNSLVTPQSPPNWYRLPLDWDHVNMDHALYGSHADRSPDEHRATRIELLPSPANAGFLTRPGTAEMWFPGLPAAQSEVSEETSILDGELCFDSDSGSELHGLEEFGDGTGHLRDARDFPAEHQVDNGSGIAEARAEVNETDGEDMFFSLEDW